MTTAMAIRVTGIRSRAQYAKARDEKSDTQHSRNAASKASSPQTFKQVSNWPANECCSASSTDALDRTA
jgi:hypothetical protein